MKSNRRKSEYIPSSKEVNHTGKREISEAHSEIDEEEETRRKAENIRFYTHRIGEMLHGNWAAPGIVFLHRMVFWPARCTCTQYSNNSKPSGENPEVRDSPARNIGGYSGRNISNLGLEMFKERNTNDPAGSYNRRQYSYRRTQRVDSTVILGNWQSLVQLTGFVNPNSDLWRFKAELMRAVPGN